MRTAAVILAFTLLAAGFAAAQDYGSSSGSTGSSASPGSTSTTGSSSSTGSDGTSATGATGTPSGTTGGTSGSSGTNGGGALLQAENDNLFADFTTTGNMMSGHWVSFSFDPATWTLSNYTIGSSTNPNGQGGSANPGSAGSTPTSGTSTGDNGSMGTCADGTTTTCTGTSGTTANTSGANNPGTPNNTSGGQLSATAIAPQTMVWDWLRVTPQGTTGYPTGSPSGTTGTSTDASTSATMAGIVQGGVWSYSSDLANVMVHNNPSALLVLRATQPVTIALMPSSGIVLGNAPSAGSTSSSGSAGWMTVIGNGIDGRLLIAGPGSFGSTTTGTSGTSSSNSSSGSDGSTSCVRCGGMDNGSNGSNTSASNTTGTDAGTNGSTSGTSTGQGITVQLQRGGMLLFQVRPQAVLVNDFEGDLNAVRNNELAGWITIVTHNGEQAMQPVDLGATLSASSVQANQVTVQSTDHRSDVGTCSASAGDSSGSGTSTGSGSAAPCSGPYAIGIILDTEGINAGNLGAITVTVDGQRLGLASGASDVYANVMSGPSGSSTGTTNPGTTSGTSGTSSTSTSGTDSGTAPSGSATTPGSGGTPSGTSSSGTAPSTGTSTGSMPGATGAPTDTTSGTTATGTPTNSAWRYYATIVSGNVVKVLLAMPAGAHNVVLTAASAGTPTGTVPPTGTDVNQPAQKAPAFEPLLVAMALGAVALLARRRRN